MLSSTERISSAMTGLEKDRSTMLARINEIASISGTHGADAREMNRRSLELAEAMPASSQEAARNSSAAAALGNAMGQITSRAAGVVDAAYQFAELGRQMDEVISQLQIPGAATSSAPALPSRRVAVA